MHCAAAKGHIDILKLLIVQGAEIEVVDGTGWASMHWAAAGGHADIVKCLVTSGADISAKDKNGVTPLWTAIEKSPASWHGGESHREVEHFITNVLNLKVRASGRVPCIQLL